MTLEILLLIGNILPTSSDLPAKNDTISSYWICFPSCRLFLSIASWLSITFIKCFLFGGKKVDAKKDGLKSQLKERDLTYIPQSYWEVDYSAFMKSFPQFSPIMPPNFVFIKSRELCNRTERQWILSWTKTLRGKTLGRDRKRAMVSKTEILAEQEKSVLMKKERKNKEINY